MTRSYIDPVSRVEGHLGVEMEVENGKVTDAWVCGNNFRGMEIILEHCAPEDAAQISQRLCGLCPVSHAHASSIAAEQAYGITISNSARIIRNIIEIAQFLRSNLLWFYNLAGLDYINPLNAANANPLDAMDLAKAVNTTVDTNLQQLTERLQLFAKNDQLSIFSGNWFDAEGGTAYRLPPELDLVLTAHYFESLQVHADIDEFISVIGGKMPHPVTLVPGGFLWYPTPNMLENLKARAVKIRDWMAGVLMPDLMAMFPYYRDCTTFGRGVGRYIAWGVFEGPGWPYDNDWMTQLKNRYMPMGIVEEDKKLADVQVDYITEYMGHSWYQGSDTYESPYYITIPEYTDYNVNDRYTWVKCANYGPEGDRKPYEAGSISRVFAAYLRQNAVNEDLTLLTDQMLGVFGGAAGDLSVVENTLGRLGMRAVEMTYMADLLPQWIDELEQVVKSNGLDDYFTERSRDSGQGNGLWEAPRGALYHAETVTGGRIDGYEIVIPTTWNLSPHNADDVPGPIETALIGVPVEDIEKPINALRTIHSFDPCTACSVQISEPATGKRFETVLDPYGRPSSKGVR